MVIKLFKKKIQVSAPLIDWYWLLVLIGTFLFNGMVCQKIQWFAVILADNNC
jgi:hypothetical protein